MISSGERHPNPVTQPPPAYHQSPDLLFLQPDLSVRGDHGRGLFLSSRDASQLDMAGAQRMLSQKMVKEALLAAQGVGAAGDVESLKSLTGRFRLEA
jgi:hypothetical protein